MNITKLIEELELDALMSVDGKNATAEDGRLAMEAAGVLRKVHRILTPFAEAAENADKWSADIKRLLGLELTGDATPGWGIQRRHLDAAREFLWENATKPTPP